MLRRLLLPAGCAVFICCTAGAGDALPPKWSAVLTRSGAIETQRGHIQGLCATGDALYMTLVDRLCKFDWQGRLLKRIELSPHVGDICIDGDTLYLVTCANGKGRIEVFDTELNHLRGAGTERSADGITCLDGVLYVGLGPAKDSDRPYRGNWFGKYDAKTLKPLCKPFLVDHGETSWLGVQNIANDGKTLFVNFYTPVTGIPNFFRFDRDFNVLGKWELGCGHGFDTVGGARPGAVRFVHSCTIGIFDQKGDSPVPAQTLLRYAEITPEGEMEDVTRYESYVHDRLRADTGIDDLRVCRMKEPGDIVRPVFSWKMKTARDGARQAAYSISLKDADGRDIWQSGLVKDGASHAIRYSGPALKSASRYVWQVIVTDDRGKEFFSQPASFSTGLLAQEEWKASEWIAVPGIDPAVPKETRKRQRANDGASVFAKTLRNPKKVKEAWWTVTGQGVFQAYVNSKALPDFLKPGFTHVFKTRHSFTYDVTPMFNREENGLNLLSATVTSGWWRDRITDWRGKESAFRAVLTVRYADGAEARFGTDATWSGAVDTHVKAAGIYDGEEYDASAPEPAWGPVNVVDEFKGEIIPMEGPKVNLRGDLKLSPKEMYVYSGVEGAKDGDAFGRAVKKDAGRNDVVLNPGETLVVDFGQNAAAVPEFRFSAKRGTRLVAKAGEMLNDANGEKSRGNDGPGGSVYRGNLNELSKWGAKAEYVFGGEGVEFYRPEWTFFGYRYLSITVSDRTYIEYIASVPVSSIAKADEAGRILTGDKRINRLAENIRWGQLSNYLSVPADCPQRNERLGWTADTQVFAPAATRNADVYGFLGKWMRDMRDTQHADGSFAGVAPLAAYGDRSERFGWCDAGVIVPYVMWKRYGDLAIVEENFDAIERYMALTAKNKFDSPAANAYQWADWLSFEPLESHDGGAFGKDAKGKTVPKADALTYWHFLGGCHWLMDAAMCAEMAGALGMKEASARYGKMEEEAREYVRRRFLGKDGGLPDFMRSMQTPNLFAVKCCIFEKPEAEAQAKKALLENIKSHGNCLQTGFLGTPVILDVLTYGLGRPDVAYTLLLQRDNPSWLYSVDQGATTVWERWNGYSKADGFLRLSMKSYNHYAYGAVLDWMYGTMAGIRPDPAAPGWRHFVLAPIPDPRVGRVHAAFESQYGTIESAWSYGGDDEIMFRFRIPPNTTARVVLPDGTEREVASGLHKYSIKGRKK